MLSKTQNATGIILSLPRSPGLFIDNGENGNLCNNKYLVDKLDEALRASPTEFLVRVTPLLRKVGTSDGLFNGLMVSANPETWRTPLKKVFIERLI